MSTLTKTDLNFIVGRLPKDVQQIIKENNIFLGGGFIRAVIAGEVPADIDIFGESKEILSTIAYKLASDRKVKVHESDNAFTLLNHPRLTVQFIYRWLYKTGTEVLNSFDFTVCQSVIWFDKEVKLWMSEISEGFYSDLAARRLVYTCPQRNEDAGGSILRVRKYLARGYNIQPNSLAKVIARLVVAVRKIDGEWSEDWLGSVITSLLREVDPLTVVDGVEIVNEHEIINEKE